MKLIQPSSRRESESANVDAWPQRRLTLSPTTFDESSVESGRRKVLWPVTTPVRVSTARKRPESVMYVLASALPTALSFMNWYEPSARVGSEAESEGYVTVRLGSDAWVPTAGPCS